MVKLNLARKSGLQEGEECLFSEIGSPLDNGSIDDLKESLTSAVETEKSHEVPYEEEVLEEEDVHEESEEEAIPHHWSRVPEEKKGSKWWLYIPLVILVAVAGYYIYTKYLPSIMGEKEKPTAIAEQPVQKRFPETTPSVVPTEENLPALNEPTALMEVKNGIALSDLCYRVLNLIPESVYLENLSVSQQKILISFYSFGIQENRFFKVDMSQTLGFQKPDRSQLIETKNLAGANFKTVISYSIKLMPPGTGRVYYSGRSADIEEFLRNSFAEAGITPVPFMLSETARSATIRFNTGLTGLNTFLSKLASHNLNIGIRNIVVESGLSEILSSSVLNVQISLVIL